MLFLPLILTWSSCWIPSLNTGSWLTPEPRFQSFLRPQLQPLLWPLQFVFSQLVKPLFLVLGAGPYCSSFGLESSPVPSTWLKSLFLSLAQIFSRLLLRRSGSFSLSTQMSCPKMGFQPPLQSIVFSTTSLA